MLNLMPASQAMPGTISHLPSDVILTPEGEMLLINKYNSAKEDGL